MDIQGYSSVGRVLVSKTMGRGFKSFCPCHRKRSMQRIGLFLWQEIETEGLEQAVLNDSPGDCQIRADRGAGKSRNVPRLLRGRTETKSFCPCQKSTGFDLSIFYSLRKQWYLITEGVYHQPQAAFSFAMMIYNTPC